MMPELLHFRGLSNLAGPSSFCKSNFTKLPHSYCFCPRSRSRSPSSFKFLEILFVALTSPNRMSPRLSETVSADFASPFPIERIPSCNFRSTQTKMGRRIAFGTKWKSEQFISCATPLNFRLLGILHPRLLDHSCVLSPIFGNFDFLSSSRDLRTGTRGSTTSLAKDRFSLVLAAPLSPTAAGHLICREL